MSIHAIYKNTTNFSKFPFCLMLNFRRGSRRCDAEHQNKYHPLQQHLSLE
jgi:hypothetical protein